MCSTSGPKYFLPPNQLGSNGPMDMPLAYASNPAPTFDAGNSMNFPAPAAVPSSPVNPISNLIRARMYGFGGFDGGQFGGFGGGLRAMRY